VARQEIGPKADYSQGKEDDMRRLHCFWVVWAEGGDAFCPVARHKDSRTADAEAKRLAAENPDAKFHVACVERTFEMNTPMVTEYMHSFLGRAMKTFTLTVTHAKMLCRALVSADADWLRLDWDLHDDQNKHFLRGDPYPIKALAQAMRVVLSAQSFEPGEYEQVGDRWRRKA
jgi:hypothetical protein